jgi:hypothetical protein
MDLVEVGWGDVDWIGLARRGTHIGCWWECQREGDHYEDQDRWLDNIRMDLVEVGWGDVD